MYRFAKWFHYGTAFALITSASFGIASCAQGSGPDLFADSNTLPEDRMKAFEGLSDKERVEAVEQRFRTRLDAHPTNMVLGVVRDLTGTPLPGVRVSVGETATETGPDGSYALEQPLGRRLMTFEHPSYATIQRPIDIWPGEARLLDATLMPHGGARRFNADEGGHISKGPISLDFEPGDLAFENGSPVHGDVEITFAVFEPNKEGHIDASPAVLEGIDADGKDVILRSYGMLDVELRKDGRKVQVRPGQTVETSLSLSDVYNIEQMPTIPMWHHDTTRGVWVEDRQAAATVHATPEGKRVATAMLPHFSSWNYDGLGGATCATILIPGRIDTTSMSVRVTSTDASGNPEGGGGIWSITAPCDVNTNSHRGTCAFNVPTTTGGFSEVYFRIEARTNNTSGFVPVSVTLAGSPTTYTRLSTSDIQQWLAANPSASGGSWCGVTKFASTVATGNIDLLLTTAANLPLKRIPFGYPQVQGPLSVVIGAASASDPGFLTVSNNERSSAAANGDADGRLDVGSPPDNCLQNSNPSQIDADGNEVGDACELWCNVPAGPDAVWYDYDLDGIDDMCDNRWSVANPSQYVP